MFVLRCIEILQRPRVCGFSGQLSVMFSSLLQTSVCLENCLSDLALWWVLCFAEGQGDSLIHPQGLEMLLWENQGAKLLNGFRSGSWPLPMA